MARKYYYYVAVQSFNGDENMIMGMNRFFKDIQSAYRVRAPNKHYIVYSRLRYSRTSASYIEKATLYGLTQRQIKKYPIYQEELND